VEETKVEYFVLVTFVVFSTIILKC